MKKNAALLFILLSLGALCGSLRADDRPYHAINNVVNPTVAGQSLYLTNSAQISLLVSLTDTANVYDVSVDFDSSTVTAAWDMQLGPGFSCGSGPMVISMDRFIHTTFAWFHYKSAAGTCPMKVNIRY